MALSSLNMLLYDDVWDLKILYNEKKHHIQMFP